MTEIKIPTTIIDSFLAETIGITTRAVKIMKNEQPERYERELIGAIFVNAKVKLPDVLSLFDNNKELLELVNQQEMLSAIKALRTVTCANSVSIQERNKQNHIVASFLNKAFNGYSNEQNHTLFFIVMYDEVEDFKTISLDNVNSKLMCELKDITCGEFGFLRQIELDSSKSISEICDIIKNEFPALKPTYSKIYSYEMNCEIELFKESEAFIQDILLNMSETPLAEALGNGKIKLIKNATLSLNDTLFEVIRFQNGIYEGQKPIILGGIHRETKDDETESGEYLNTCNLCMDVINKYEPDNKDAQTLYEKAKAELLRLTNPERFDEDEDMDYGFLFNLSTLATDLVMPGLSSAIFDISFNALSSGLYSHIQTNEIGTKYTLNENGKYTITLKGKGANLNYSARKDCETEE